MSRSNFVWGNVIVHVLCIIRWILKCLGEMKKSVLKAYTRQLRVEGRKPFSVSYHFMYKNIRLCKHWLHTIGRLAALTDVIGSKTGVIFQPCTRWLMELFQIRMYICISVTTSSLKWYKIHPMCVNTHFPKVWRSILQNTVFIRRTTHVLFNYFKLNKPMPELLILYFTLPPLSTLRTKITPVQPNRTHPDLYPTSAFLS